MGYDYKNRLKTILFFENYLRKREKSVYNRLTLAIPGLNTII